MRKRFTFAREDQLATAWLARFAAGREEAERWYLGQGRAPPPSSADCRAALSNYMPELLPQYERACALVGDDDGAHQIISQYRPPPIIAGCSQAIWLGNDGPALVRNYDFAPDAVSDRFEVTSWFGRKVIAKAQRPWGGCIDGMNEDGLVASLTFGGSPAMGRGFAVILLLRYVLETCGRVEEAAAKLTRIPIAQSQNVMLLDRSGAYATLYLGPDRLPAETANRVCTNHQEKVVWPEHGAISRTLARRDALLRQLADPGMTLDRLVECLLAPPLYSRWVGSPTAYTAVYRPAAGTADYLWPGKRWRQSIHEFEPGAYTHDYGVFLA
jgi:predicted choloylglycine hydrolase